MSNIQNLNEELWLKHEDKIDAMIKSTVGYSKKNLIPYPYYYTTQSQSGIDWTDLGDGRIQANGTATVDSIFQLHHRISNPTTIKNGNYILNGVSKDIADSGCYIAISNTVDSQQNILARDEGNGANLTLSTDENVGIFIVVPSGATLDNVIFEPMLRYARIEDDTFESYVDDIQTQVGAIKYLSLPHSLGSTSSGKPQLELKAQIGKFDTRYTNFMGTISVGSRYGFYGYLYKTSDGIYGAFVIYGYTLTMQVYVKAGVWKYETIMTETDCVEF